MAILLYIILLYILPIHKLDILIRSSSLVSHTPPDQSLGTHMDKGPLHVHRILGFLRVKEKAL